MKTYLRSVRFGLMRTLTIGAVITSLLVICGLVAMNRLDVYVNAIYLRNTVPIGHLAKLQAGFMEARRKLWKAMAVPGHADDERIVANVSKELDKIEEAWSAYFPDGVSSPEEEIASHVLRQELPEFRSLAESTAGMIAAGLHGAASDYLASKIGLMMHIEAEIQHAIDANISQAAGLNSDSKRVLEQSMRVAAILLGLTFAVFCGFALRVLRERDDARRTTSYSLWLVDQAFEMTHDGMMITDANAVIEKVNPAFLRITGYTEDELIGNTPRLLSSGRQSQDFYRGMWQTLRDSGHWSGELWNRRKDGAIYRESLSINGIRGPRGKISNFVAVCADITQRQLAQDRLGYLATHDALTDLPNRVLLNERLAQAIARARRGQSHVAVMFVDLDGFKGINDTLGHGIGDETLIAVAKRLKESLREADTVARLGGDEFAIVLEDIERIDSVRSVAEKIVKAIGGIDSIQGWTIRITPSIGIALYPDDAKEPQQLLQMADESMYVAKRSGKNGFIFSAMSALEPS